MKIIVQGKENNVKKEYVYNLLDRYDKITKLSSMARTTGFTATAAANLVLQGKMDRKGICPPEFIGESEDNFNFIMSYLEKRNIYYHKTEK